MREIKFRVYDPITKKIYPVNDINFWLDQVNAHTHPNDKEKYELVDLDEGGILMQYTGLKDKNGKEIYEGDLVKLTGWYYKNERQKEKQDFDLVCRVEYDNTVACYNLIHVDLPGSYLKFFDVLIVTHDRQFEVIGNIYSNPELLEAITVHGAKK